jgi:hypothetical protein
MIMPFLFSFKAARCSRGLLSAIPIRCLTGRHRRSAAGADEFVVRSPLEVRDTLRKRWRLATRLLGVLATPGVTGGRRA